MIHYEGHGVQLHHGDCLDVLRTLPDASVDAVVTDPPYNLGFMGKAWDSFGGSTGMSNETREAQRNSDEWWASNYGGYLSGVPAAPKPGQARAFQQWCEQWATECLRVLKPGGHLLAFGGTRTWHRLTCAVEDAGFEIRDSIAWLYGSGFPKSLDVSKAIDRARDDRDDVLTLTTTLADLADAAGITRAGVDEAMGTSDMGGWWLSRLRHRCACPSVDNWTRLRDLIPGAPALDDLVWRLNGRKGSPGEAWETREVLGERKQRSNVSNVQRGVGLHNSRHEVETITAPATPDAQTWQGWGTALKPAFEPVVVARKPLTGTVAATVLQWGTGALNIDACRVETDDFKGMTSESFAGTKSGENSWNRSDGGIFDAGRRGGWLNGPPAGRWPANVVLDEHQAATLDEMSGESTSPPVGSVARTQGGNTIGTFAHEGRPPSPNGHGDSGGASRFFYVAREDPLDGLPRFRYEAKAPSDERPNINGTAHATVKPLALMRWLVRLVTPPGGTVLEPFAGSGTTVEAAILEGFHCIAIEKGEEYLPLIMSRITRQRDPVEAIKLAGEDLGLFGLDGWGA